ncbi:MAG: wax ester/triacylglycerol synthase family O-acyltransferase [Microthrixaceae bacterium]
MATDRLSPLDSAFLHLENDYAPMHIGSTSIFEGPAPEFQLVRGIVEGKLDQIPRYRQVARFVPLNLGRPVWTDDPHFNLDYHMRHTALPTPGGREQLRLLVARVMSQQLDRSRPLWEMWVVEGLEDGQWAIISKVHHAMVDGVSGAELLSTVLDISPEVPKPQPSEWSPKAPPSELELAGEAVGDLVRSPYEQLRALRAATRVPRQAIENLSEVASGLTSMAGILPPTPLSSINGPIGPHRRYVWTSVDVDDIKRVRKALGGSFNDVILTTITRGFRALLESRGESTDRVVRTLVPVSVRPRSDGEAAHGDGTMDNQVSAMFAELPVMLEDPADALAAVCAQMEGLKESNQALAGEALTSMAEFTPPMLLALGERAFARAAQRNVNTVTTNVPGPQLPLYSAGCRMTEVYPYVPLAEQVRIGVAMFSYDGCVYYGVTGDFDTCEDIDVLANGVEVAMAELLELADAPS